ncbi:tRNA (adenosine(37)-N6)-threonylcarbamoyltransferase complex dimerization subunit type 1 TsaB [candidate division KSB1 bacterium]|nr:tRNA (adenosine(37)-N6)-threonylcarbamoyltransferase complex dimerization subunit type 1 TsaB [candidate division KSB1 bacterium]
MTILGIETATQICSAALINDKTVRAEYRLNLKNIHASALVSMIDTIMQKCQCSVADVAALAISIGPGSFTGLRIGLSVAKGLALGAAIPVVAVPTLEALACHAPVRDGLVCPILKSRAFEYFYAIFERRDYRDKMLQPPQLIKKDQIASALPSGSLLIGQTEDFADGERGNYIFPPAFMTLPSAFSVARLGLEKFKTGDIAAVDTMEPMYFQNFVAEKVGTGHN